MIYVKKGALIKLVEESAAAKYTANGFTVMDVGKLTKKPKKTVESPNEKDGE